MASIIEELIDVLNKENEAYQELIPITEEKTKAIVKNDLEKLTEITGQEQIMVDRIYALSKKREDVIHNMGIVLNRQPSELKLSVIVELLKNQPNEYKKLSRVFDELSISIRRLVENNTQNKMLIEDSLGMLEFNINLLNNARVSPGSNTYNKSAFQNDNETYNIGLFDTKQ